MRHNEHQGTHLFLRKNVKVGTDDGPTRFPHYIIECATCDSSDKLKVTNNAGHMPTEVVAKKFSQTGWAIGKNRNLHTCPACIKRIAESRKVKKEHDTAAERHFKRTAYAEKDELELAIERDIAAIRDAEVAGASVKLLDVDVPARAAQMHILVQLADATREQSYIETAILELMDRHEKWTDKIKHLREQVTAQFKGQVSSVVLPLDTSKGEAEEMAKRATRKTRQVLGVRMAIHKAYKDQAVITLGSDVLEMLGWQKDDRIAFAVGIEESESDYGFLILNRVPKSDRSGNRLMLRPDCQSASVRTTMDEVTDAVRKGIETYEDIYYESPNGNELWVRFAEPVKQPEAVAAE